MKRINKDHRPTQRGDTIIEVLVCTAAIALVMIVTYTTINGSYLRYRETQERSQAVNLAATQIEALIKTGSSPKDCFSITVSLAGGGSTTATPQINSNANTLVGGAGNSCVLAGNGSIATATTVPAFNVKITKAANLTYTVNVKWQSFRTVDQTALEYRLQ